MARTSNKPSGDAPRSAPARKVPWGGIITGGVLVIAVLALVLFDSPPPGVEFPNQGNFHLGAVDEAHAPYSSSPPSSGPHLGLLANWGVSEEAIPAELFVHNLEDGGVVIAYDCPAGCEDFKAALSDFVERKGGRLLMTAYEGIEHEGAAYRGAAVAWGRVFYFDETSDEVLSELEVFVDIYEGVDHHVR